ncbi:MAG: fused MFS/spermidine synthase [Vicinamibacterales bacterium]
MLPSSVSAARRAPASLLPALAILFFFSGAAALVYQVLWLRLLGLVFGVTVHAATTVLASFMSGLALGSAVAGRLAPRLRRPLLWFAAAELLIAVAALATQPAIGGVSELYVGLHPRLAGSTGGLTMARFLAAWAVLLVPTALMGASLPLVLKSSLGHDPAIGSRFAVLYASNTAGAIVGTLVVGFVLIERVGIAASFVIAAAANILVAMAAFTLDRLLGGAGARGSDPVRDRASGIPLSGEERLVLAVFAVSGFAALALEIVWFRLLVLFVPATTYAFTTMLAAVLFGIAAGSAAATPLLRRLGDARRTLASVEVAVGFAAMLSMAALVVTYRAGWRTSGTIQASVLTIAPACVLMGLAFPIGVSLMTRSASGLAGVATNRVAVLYAVNVGGAIAGAAAAGFLLVPGLGIAGSLIVIAALHVAAGLLLLRGRRRAAVAAVVVGAFVGTAALLPDPVTSLIRRRYGAAERIWWREEGAQSTVSVHVRPGGGRQILYLDGLHQANDSSEMVRVHRQIGHLPMALHPNPRRALVIGLGAGATAGAVSRYATTQVTVVELSPSVVRAARMFGHINHRVVEAPNVRIAIDDARNHLLVARARYDVITADIIQPIHAGAGNLYSREYFELVRKALTDGGLALQWIGHRDETPYRLIMQTFLSVFPSTTVWADGTLLLGSLEPLTLDRDVFERKLADAGTRSALAEVDLTTFDALLASYTAGPDEIRAFVGGSPLLTDDRPRIEYFGSLPENERGIDLRGLRGDVQRHVRR